MLLRSSLHIIIHTKWSSFWHLQCIAEQIGNLRKSIKFVCIAISDAVDWNARKSFSQNRLDFLLLCFQRTSEHTIYMILFQENSATLFKIDRFFSNCCFIQFFQFIMLIIIDHVYKKKINEIFGKVKCEKNMITKSAKNQINVHTIGPWKIDVKIGFYCSNLSRKRLSTKSKQHSCLFAENSTSHQ